MFENVIFEQTHDIFLIYNPYSGQNEKTHPETRQKTPVVASLSIAILRKSKQQSKTDRGQLTDKHRIRIGHRIRQRKYENLDNHEFRPVLYGDQN